MSYRYNTADLIPVHVSVCGTERRRYIIHIHIHVKVTKCYVEVKSTDFLSPPLPLSPPLRLPLSVPLSRLPGLWGPLCSLSSEGTALSPASHYVQQHGVLSRQTKSEITTVL